MYFISLKNGPKKAFYFFATRDYIVGRRDCDILIGDDSSISRKHASLGIKNGKFYITDLGAKYNTFVNNVKLKPNVLTELNSNDEIKFGILSSVYRVKEEKLNVAISGVTVDEKKMLSRILKRIGGSLSINWSKECSHLTVREIMLTLKVLCALIERQPIITLDFWTEYLNNVNSNLPPPDPSDYKAAFAVNVVNRNINFREECCRKTLFKNKVFIFKNKASKAKIEEVVELAGGTCFYWNQKPLTEDNLSSNNPQYLLIQDDSKNSDEDDCFMKMINYLHSISKRSIPFQEIAMAIVLGSCEKDCNPNFDRAGTLIKPKEQIVFTNDVLAFETQTQDDRMEVKPSIVVPETAGDELIQDERPANKNMDAGGNKREAQELGNENKRIRINSKEVKETYSALFQGRHNAMVTSTLKIVHDIDKNTFDSSTAVVKNIEECNVNKKQLTNDNPKRIQEELHNNEKRIRLEEHVTGGNGWVTVSKQKAIEPEKSIDLTLDDNEVVSSTQIEKSVRNTSRLADHAQKSANPFGFTRCGTNTKTTAKVSDFFKPISAADRNVADISAIDLDFPSTSGKRKFDEVSSSKANKKQNLLVNPFSKAKESDNPFQNRITGKEGTSKNNPFTLSLQKTGKLKKDEPVKSGKKTLMPYVFNVTVVDTEIENNYGWLSKSTSSKDETDNRSNNFTHIDETMQRFMESFNNCVVIEKLPLIVERTLITQSSETTINGSKNFKKFKKVQPLHIQTTIIPRAMYISGQSEEIGMN